MVIPNIGGQQILKKFISLGLSEIFSLKRCALSLFEGEFAMEIFQEVVAVRRSKEDENSSKFNSSDQVGMIFVRPS